MRCGVRASLVNRDGSCIHPTFPHCNFSKALNKDFDELVFSLFADLLNFFPNYPRFPSLMEGLKDLFVLWLQKHHEDLTKKGSRLAHAYAKAAEKVKAHSDEISTPQQLKSIQYVGEKILQLLCARLKTHCKENAIPVPPAFENYVASDAADAGKRHGEIDTVSPKKRRVSKWVPKRRSGSWAILVALHTKDHARRGLRKEDVISAATPFCDASFTANPAARDFYSAWDGVKTLLKRDLVACAGRPKLYVITPEGEKMAALILEQEDLPSEPENAPDQSFDNGVRVSPALSAANLLLFLFEDTSPLRAPRSPPKHDHKQRIYNGVSYDIWEPCDFEVVLIMDNREIRSQSERDFFSSRLSVSNVICETRPLSVGDVLWVARHKRTGKEAVLNYICERKRLDDLAMSIRDGRFSEQKNRLKRLGITNVHYLVEEGGLGDVQRIIEMKKAIETAIAMVVTVSNFYMQRFRRTDDTVEWLASMTEVLKTRYSAINLMVVKPQYVNTQDEYLHVLEQFRAKFEYRRTPYECVHTFLMYQATLVKTSMMTVKQMFTLMLMLVRGILFEKAAVIQLKFDTPRKLIEFYTIDSKSLSETEKSLLMADLFKNNFGGKKINKAALAAMYEAWGKE